MTGFLRSLAAAMCMTALLAGCSTPDRELEMLRRDTPPAAGMSRVVVYFPSRFLVADDPLKVDVDGKNACYLKDGGYSVGEIAPATHDFAFSYCGTRNLTHVTLTTVPGHTYYLRVMPYDSSITGILSGYPGEQVDKEESAEMTATANGNIGGNAGGNVVGMKGSGRGEGKNKEKKNASKLHNGPFEVKQIDAHTALEALSSMQYESSPVVAR